MLPDHAIASGKMSWSSYLWHDAGKSHVILRDDESGKCFLSGGGGAEEEIQPHLFHAAVKTNAAKSVGKDKALEAATKSAKAEVLGENVFLHSRWGMAGSAYYLFPTQASGCLRGPRRRPWRRPTMP